MSALTSLQNKVLDTEVLSKQVEAWRAQGDTIVFTNGVFDLLHRGHVHYLAQAADLGNRLVIGLNSDVSAKTLGKGPTRPLKDQDSRALILAALQVVDAVCLFDTHTPYDLIKVVQPDVLVKGGDYTVEQIAGHDIVQARGGQVICLDFLPGYSTTAIEQKIKSED